jgi:membrane protein YdbS with pleckstrin-like domain
MPPLPQQGGKTDRMLSTPPREHLDPRALRLWRIGEVVQSVFFVVIGAAVTAALVYLTDLSPFLAALPVVLAIIISVADVVLVPTLRWKNWRYEVRDLEVDLQRGLLTITRTRVPMARIQHVDTRRGPLEQRFGLATVILYTAAGANQIPSLDLAVADNVRDRIASLANTHDDV